MKTLILIRHAKSDWNSPSGDFHRPLAQRGLTDAALVASRVLPLLPEHFNMWSSSAKRAAQTANIFASHFNRRLESIDFKDGLYTFDQSALAGIIAQCPNVINALIVFGHNAAITDFVNKFGDIFIDNVPTAGFVTLTFNANDWHALGNGKTGPVIFPSHFRP